MRLGVDFLIGSMQTPPGIGKYPFQVQCPHPSPRGKEPPLYTYLPSQSADSAKGPPRDHVYSSPDEISESLLRRPHANERKLSTLDPEVLSCWISSLIYGERLEFMSSVSLDLTSAFDSIRLGF